MNVCIYTYTRIHTIIHTYIAGSCNGEKGSHILGGNWFNLCRGTFTYRLGIDRGETLSDGIHGITVRIDLVVVVFGEEKSVSVDVALGDLDVASRQSECVCVTMTDIVCIVIVTALFRGRSVVMC
jgi:hypothetical protein